MKLEIDGRYTNIKFSACHFITEHFKCGRLHGHVYVIRMVLHGSRGENGMIMDFIDLKRALRDIAEEFDHRILLPGNSPRLMIEVGDEIEVTTAGKRYVFPPEDVLILDAIESSAEEVARVILERVLQEIEFPETVTRVELGIDEERGQSAWVDREIR